MAKEISSFLRLDGKIILATGSVSCPHSSQDFCTLRAKTHAWSQVPVMFVFSNNNWRRTWAFSDFLDVNSPRRPASNLFPTFPRGHMTPFFHEERRNWQTLIFFHPAFTGISDDLVLYEWEIPVRTLHVKCIQWYLAGSDEIWIFENFNDNSFQ